MMLPASTSRLSIIRLVSLVLLSAATAACAFDQNGGLGSCLIGFGTDSGNGKILDNAHSAAQSFVVSTGTQDVSKIALKMRVFSNDGVTRPSATIKAYIYSDASVTNPITPTTPTGGSAQGGPGNFGSITVGGANDPFKTLNFSTTINFTLAVSPTNVTAAAYWVYVTSDQAPSATQQVWWEQTLGDAYTQGFPWYQGAFPTGFDLMTQIGCGS